MKLKLSAEEAVILSVMSALSSVGRIIFAAIPNVQPSSAIIILCGIFLGPISGGIVGVVTVLISNIFLGFGPWTFGQVIMWGMMGVTAGWLSKALKGQISLMVVFGFLWGFLYGWGMNLFTYKMFLPDINVVWIFASSFPFDLAHAVGNVIFIVMFSTLAAKTFVRIKSKYGVFERRAL